MGEAKRKRRELIETSEWTPEEIKILEEEGGRPVVKRKRRDFSDTVADLMSAQPQPVINQDGIPPNLNVFATMEAAWLDLVGRWFHTGMPDKLKQDGKFIFYHGVQAAANLMMYCEGQDMFGAAADQVQGDCIAYEKEAEAVAAERKADEWRTGEI